MASGNGDSNGPPAADGGDRGLLLGLSDGGGDAAEDPGAAPGCGEPPEGMAASLAAVAAGLGRLEALLSALEARLAAGGGSGPGLSEEAARIVEAADGIGDLKATIAEAAEFTRDTKEATGILQAEAGKQAARLKEGRDGLDKAVAALLVREKGLKAREDALGKGVKELRALWKEVSETSTKLAAEIATLANHYGRWEGQVASHREDMTALTGALRSGGAEMKSSVAANAKAQREISLTTLDNVQKFARENALFMRRIGEAREEFLETVRREWSVARRWTVPALAAALVLAVPSFAVVGAYAQSEFRIFRPYDETKGWRQGVWERHGEQVKDCMLESLRGNKTVRCSFDVEYF